jgi:hypothetical protein
MCHVLEGGATEIHNRKDLALYGNDAGAFQLHDEKCLASLIETTPGSRRLMLGAGSDRRGSSREERIPILETQSKDDIHKRGCFSPGIVRIPKRCIKPSEF